MQDSRGSCQHSPFGLGKVRFTISDHESVMLLGVQIQTISPEQLIHYLMKKIRAGERAIVAYANVYAINLSQEVPWFKEFLNSADVTYCDGYGVKWGAGLFGSNIPHRFTPPDWFHQLAGICEQNHISLFLLGAQPGIAEKFADRLQQQFPTLEIIGTYHGYFDKSPGSSENEAILQFINAKAPDILVVGMGMPLQERWLLENWDRIDARIALPVGALFDYMTNNVPRAPRWMTNHGLEWLGRLVFEPRRLWKRYLIGNPLFVWRILKHRFGHN